MKAYQLSTNDGNASWTVNGCHGPRQGTKAANGKITNCSSSSSYYYSRKKRLFHDSSFMDVDTALRITLTRKKRIDGRTNQFEKQQYTWSN